METQPLLPDEELNRKNKLRMIIIIPIIVILLALLVTFIVLFAKEKNKNKSNTPSDSDTPISPTDGKKDEYIPFASWKIVLQKQN